MPLVRVYTLASAPVARTGLHEMLEASAKVFGEGDGSAVLDPTSADVVLVDGDELLEEVTDVVMGGAPAVVVISEDDRSVRTLQAPTLRGWGHRNARRVARGVGGRDSRGSGSGSRRSVVLPRLFTERLFYGTVAEDLDEPLTNREREVLELLGQGLSNKLIARRLHISEHTVKFHISSLYAKLGISSRAEAVSRGARYGLLSF